jgi:hypothetical protein
MTFCMRYCKIPIQNNGNDYAIKNVVVLLSFPHRNVSNIECPQPRTRKQQMNDSINKLTNNTKLDIYVFIGSIHLLVDY